MKRVSPKTARLLRKLIVNKWSDEARKAALESRRRKSKHSGGSVLGTIAKAGVITAGAIAGGLLGGRTLPRLIGRGRLARIGENLTGKVVYTTPPKTLAGHEGWSIGSIIPVGRKRDLSTFLKEHSKKSGATGKIAKGLSKAEQWIGVPERHFGVGTRKNQVSHFSPSGVHKETRGKFGAYWAEYMNDRNPANVWVVDEGRISGKKGLSRKREISSLLARLSSRKKWRGKDLSCLGKQNCETFARGISSGKKQYKSRLALTAGAGISGGGVAGGSLTSKALSMTGQDKKKKTRVKVHNLLQVINGGPGSGFHGHKGIPGHRGGSQPKGGAAIGGSTYRPYALSAPLSESVQSRAKRIRLVFTKAERLGDVFSDRADVLERKRRKKILPLNRTELLELYDAHKNAAENLRSSAEQSTLIKKFAPTDQLKRMERADYHAALARSYAKRLDKQGQPGMVKMAGKAFLKELTKGLADDIKQAGVGVAKETIRQGFKEALAQRGRKITDLEKVPGSSTVKYPDIEGAPLVRVEKPATHKPVSREATFTEKLGSVARQMRRTAKATAKRSGKSMLEGRRSNREQSIEDAKQWVKDLRSQRQRIDREIHDLGGTVSDSGKSGDDKKLREELEFQKKQVSFLNDLLKARGVQNKLEALIANLAGHVRREKLHDRDYLVAPLTMIVPGVLAGSKGPLLYPEEEVAKNPGAWNGMPIVVNHPMKDGIPVEARSPGVLERYQIGVVFNAKYNGKLVAEGWFDVDRTRKTNIGIYEQLINNSPIELSTGLYTDNEPFEGVWNGRRYSYVARNYRPDHLAILLGSRGACSIKDGCGVLINRVNPTANIIHKIKGGYKLISHKGKNLGKAKSKAGILKRMRQVEYFKHIKNEQTVNQEVSAIVGIIRNARIPYATMADKYTPIRDAVGIIKRAIGYGIQKRGGVKGIAKKAFKRGSKGSGKVAKFIKRHPTVSGMAGAGAVGYHYGRKKKRSQPTTNISNRNKKHLRMAGGFGAGLGGAAAGTVGGAKLGALAGTALAPVTGGASIPIGALIGGAAGGAAGAFGAHRIAKKVGGRSAGAGAAAGGLVGSLVTPSGAGSAAARLAGKAPQAVKAARGFGNFRKLARAIRSGSGTAGLRAGRMAKSAAVGTGRFATEMGAYSGTTAGLEKASRMGRKQKRPRQQVANAWTEAARRKSAETRRLKAQADERARFGTTKAVAVGALLGKAGSKLVEPEIDKATNMTRKFIRKGAKLSFKKLLRIIKHLRGK